MLLDLPAFATGGASGTMPLIRKTVTSKSGTAVLRAVTQSPVYVTAMYDPSGQLGQPPSGSSAGRCSKELLKLEPIKVKLGKTGRSDFQL